MRACLQAYARDTVRLSIMHCSQSSGKVLGVSVRTGSFVTLKFSRFSMLNDYTVRMPSALA
jgi:hypothetical protein